MKFSLLLGVACQLISIDLNFVSIVKPRYPSLYSKPHSDISITSLEAYLFLNSLFISLFSTTRCALFIFIALTLISIFVLLTLRSKPYTIAIFIWTLIQDQKCLHTRWSFHSLSLITFLLLDTLISFFAFIRWIFDKPSSP